MDSKRPLKRSQKVALTTLTMAGVVAVQGCGSTDWGDEAAVDALPFASVAECSQSGQVPASACQAAYNEALANHEQAAPRFDSQSLCEEEFGSGQCQPRLAGNNNYWVPMLAGFMVAQMMDRDRSYYRYGPLYRSYRYNSWYTGGPRGGQLYRSGSSWRAGSSAFDRPVSNPPVRSRSSTSSRGGFGGRSSSSWGG